MLFCIHLQSVLNTSFNSLLFVCMRAFCLKYFLLIKMHFQNHMGDSLYSSEFCHGLPNILIYFSTLLFNNILDYKTHRRPSRLIMGIYLGKLKFNFQICKKYKCKSCSWAYWVPGKLLSTQRHTHTQAISAPGRTLSSHVFLMLVQKKKNERLQSFNNQSNCSLSIGGWIRAWIHSMGTVAGFFLVSAWCENQKDLTACSCEKKRCGAPDDISSYIEFIGKKFSSQIKSQE